jgi:hypothetical protein
MEPQYATEFTARQKPESDETLSSIVVTSAGVRTKIVTVLDPATIRATSAASSVLLARRFPNRTDLTAATQASSFVLVIWALAKKISTERDVAVGATVGDTVGVDDGVCVCAVVVGEVLGAAVGAIVTDSSAEEWDVGR